MNIFTENNTPFYIKMSGADIVSEIIDDLLVNFRVNNLDSNPNQLKNSKNS